MKLEELIRQFREREHLTMQEFADRCGLSKGFVSMLEKGQHPQSKRRLIPSLATLKKISVGMGLSLDELLLMLDGDTTVSLVRDPTDYSLSPDERQLIEDYRSLTPPGQEYIRQTMAMAKMSYSEKNDALPNLEDAN